jgi:hypothetical protein
MVLTTVYVFEEGMEPPAHPQLAAEAPAEDRQEEAGRSFAEALAQFSSTVPPVPEVGKNDGAEHFRALLESAQHHAPPPEAGEESDLAHHLRKVLKQTLQSPDGIGPHDIPAMEHRD